MPPTTKKADYLNPNTPAASNGTDSDRSGSIENGEGGPALAGGGVRSTNGGVGFVDEFNENAESSKEAGAMKTSLWELAALQNHYHPAVATLVRKSLPLPDHCWTTAGHKRKAW